MTDKAINLMWDVSYTIPYRALRRFDLGRRSRNEQAEEWLRSLPLRPHLRFARMIEREVRAEVLKELSRK